MLAPVQIGATITPKALSVVGTGVAGKVYDGTTGAAATAGTLTGLVGNETLQIAGVTGAFDSANAGARTATVGYALADGANGGLAANYVLAPVQVAGSITPKALGVAGNGVAGKVYDGTTAASITAGTLTGLVGNETLEIAGVTGTFDSANAGARTATVGYALADGANGGLAANYVLAPVQVAGTIARKALGVAGTSVADRAYDGTAVAAATAGTLAGLVGNEALEIAGVNGAFDSANAGARTATVGYALADGANGGLAANYVLAPVQIGATITPKTLGVAGTTVANRAYDGTTAATASAGTLLGLVGGERLGVTAKGMFDGANAGHHLATVDYTLADGGNGGLALNYTLASTEVAGTITPKVLSAIGTSVATRAYDGTTAAATSAGTLQGLVGAEQLAVSTTGTFDSANAGTRTATVDYILANGANGGLASNYVLGPVAVSARITPKVLSAIGTSVVSRAYDGTTVAAATAGTLDGLVGAEQLDVSATGTFDSANAGTRTATVGFALANGANGGLAANYALAPVTVSSSIKPKTLTVAGTTAADKNYDGNTAAALRIGALSGLVGNETLGVAATGIFDGASPGQHAASVSYTLTDGSNGGLASNYALADETTPVAQIRPMTAVDNARAVAQQALAIAQLTAGATGPSSTVTVPAALPNVVALPRTGSTSFSLDNALTLLSAPRAGDRSEAVPLSAARDMLGGNIGSGRDVRVPVGRNTLAEIVNGGVRLPSGVDQLLFVVADGNAGNGTGNAQSGKQQAEGAGGTSLNGNVNAQKRD